MKLSIHDNLLYSYEALCEQKTIILHTKYLEIDPPEYTDIIFKGIEAYHLMHDTFGNIILDIEEVSAKTLIDDYRAELENSLRFGVLLHLGRELDDIQGKLESAGIKGFILSASLGLNGWVLAKSMSIEPAQPKNQADEK